jgi:hypothetical protein
MPGNVTFIRDGDCIRILRWPDVNAAVRSCQHTFSRYAGQNAFDHCALTYDIALSSVFALVISKRCSRSRTNAPHECGKPPKIDKQDLQDFHDYKIQSGSSFNLVNPVPGS